MFLDRERKRDTEKKREREKDRQRMKERDLYIDEKTGTGRETDGIQR